MNVRIVCQQIVLLYLNARDAQGIYDFKSRTIKRAIVVKQYEMHLCWLKITSFYWRIRAPATTQYCHWTQSFRNGDNSDYMRYMMASLRWLGALDSVPISLCRYAFVCNCIGIAQRALDMRARLFGYNLIIRKKSQRSSIDDFSNRLGLAFYTFVVAIVFFVQP